MEFKGTRTNWRFYGKNEVVDQHGAIIADCNLSQMISNDEKIANTKLIAAAPELFEACREALKYVDIEEPAFDIITKAINKATK